MINILIILFLLIGQAENEAKEHFNRGFNRYKNNDFPGAIHEYSKAISVDPFYIRAHYYRGVAHYDIKKYEDAIYDFSTVISLEGGNANAWFYRGLSRYRSGDKINGCDDIRRANSLGLHVVDYISRMCN